METFINSSVHVFDYFVNSEANYVRSQTWQVEQYDEKHVDHSLDTDQYLTFEHLEECDEKHVDHSLDTDQYSTFEHLEECDEMMTESFDEKSQSSDDNSATSNGVVPRVILKPIRIKSSMERMDPSDRYNEERGLPPDPELQWKLTALRTQRNYSVSLLGAEIGCGPARVYNFLTGRKLVRGWKEMEEKVKRYLARMGVY